MFQHDYDNNGIPTCYLLITLLLPVALYYTYSFYRLAGQIRCKCKACKTDRQTVPKIRLLFISSLWAVIAFLCYKIHTANYTGGQSKFDPLAILGIEEGATQKEIKKAYRKSLKQAKKREKKGKELQAVLAKINKSYEIVTNPEEYSKWLDRTVEDKHIIALPEVLLRARFASCLVYLLIFMALIPCLAWLYSRRTQTKSSFGIFYGSIEMFWENIGLFSKSEEIAIPQLILFISRCKDFTAYCWETNLTDTKKNIETTYGLPAMSSEQGYLHIFDYLCRSGSSSQRETLYVKKTLLAFIKAYSEVSKICETHHIFKALCTLEKMVVQAIPSPEFQLLQFPNVGVSEAFENSKTGPKDGSMKMEKEILNKILDGEDKKEALAVFEMIPKITIDILKIYVISTNTDEESDLYGKFDKIECKDGDIFKVEKGATPTAFIKIKVSGSVSECHSPYGKIRVNHRWIFYYVLDGVIQPGMKEFDFVDGEHDIDFAFKFSHGKSSELKICFISNGYFGSDIERTVPIKYY